jgi:hypothetical protein
MTITVTPSDGVPVLVTLNLPPTMDKETHARLYHQACDAATMISKLVVSVSVQTIDA